MFATSTIGRWQGIKQAQSGIHGGLGALDILSGNAHSRSLGLGKTAVVTMARNQFDR